MTMEGENIRLKKDNEYMYQVQPQIQVCDMEYVDFVLWTQKDIQTQRIEGEPTMWAEMVAASGTFSRRQFGQSLLANCTPDLVCCLCQNARDSPPTTIQQMSFLSPRTATMSPVFRLVSMLQCSVVYLSLVLPPHIFDRYDIFPRGVTTLWRPAAVSTVVKLFGTGTMSLLLWSPYVYLYSSL